MSGALELLTHPTDARAVALRAALRVQARADPEPATASRGATTAWTTSAAT